MSSPRSETAIATYLFFMILGLTLLVYLLRGFGLLGFIPGGIVWILIVLSIAAGIYYGIEKTSRF
ncbi:MAG: hypothetical protein SAJ12_12525 [Jaaginema sp. PMC 1079.18]|nr:hypothetical protein [Jaaginema sp. PMC 1080.18]MEC4851832.1 hypothetical protein [Jaaginema sp. PMC 1079.18]MEC4865201.1 hypothetical protein [Jaaginema sp. PMC 1078.18]